MLQNTVWRQYNKENNFREILSKYTHIDSLDMIEDDKELYSVLKAKLTKKELRLLAMQSGNVDDAMQKEEFSYNDEELQKAKEKLYKKLKQDKIRLPMRATPSAI